MACLIDEEVAGDFIDGHENKTSACVLGFLRDFLHGVVEDSRTLKWLSWWSGFSGLDSLALLIHVSHFRLWRQRCDSMSIEMFAPANP
jgi:hypothetical protein